VTKTHKAAVSGTGEVLQYVFAEVNGQFGPFLVRVRWRLDASQRKFFSRVEELPESDLQLDVASSSQQAQTTRRRAGAARAQAAAAAAQRTTGGAAAGAAE
jgi:hypothetical protein